MQANKIAPLAAALLFLGSSLAVAASTDTVQTVPLPTGRHTLLGELADRVAPDLRGDLALLEPLLPSHETPSVGAALDAVEYVHGAYADAATVREALASTAAMAGRPLQAAAAPAPASAAAEILAMYSLAGEAFTLADVVELEARLAQLTPAQQSGLATLVAAVNQALVLQNSGGSGYDAAAGVLDAADAVEGLFAPQASASASCDVFEDPLQLIWLGSPCDDTVAAQPARMLSYDPGGNDLYNHNAGGAGGVPGLGAGLVRVGFELDHTVGEFLDGFRAEGLVPIAPFNTTWQDTLVNGAPDNVINGTLYAVGFLPTFVGGVHLITEVHPELLRTSVALAVHIDEAGDDRYESSLLYSQGSANLGNLGLLLDRSGADTYDCVRLCQAHSNKGLGILADELGDDSYVGGSNNQANGDGGLLFEMAGNDVYTATEGNAQGSILSLSVPRAAPTLLLDRSGADLYQAFGPVVQGSGAMLVDLAGDDVYTQDGHPQGQAQGVGAALSLGLLLDASGNDQYTAEAESQGAALTGPGVLADLAGNDAYTAVNAGQAVARATGFALLYDESGDDTYAAASGQGAATDAATAVLLDRAGDDSYTATGSAQGVSFGGVGGVLSLLMDVSGSDTYVAGANSQGSGAAGSGVGMLADLKGKDSYTAGDFSQGSGGEHSGVGILLDGTPERTQLPGLEVTVQVNPESPSHDAFTAGHYSQGSSGPSLGGVGILLEREHNGGQRNVFVAGDHSQGAADGNGVGLLLNNAGKDDYTAGAFSQGASAAGLGVLVDQAGNDRYFPSTAATSHGYGESGFASAPVIAIGLLVDDGGNDVHPDMGDNQCKQKGDIGLAVDANGLALPGDCAGDALAAISELLSEAAGEAETLVMNTINGILFPSAPPPPPGTIYFHDDMEDSSVSATKWTATAPATVPSGLTKWIIRNQTETPQPSPNAHTGAQYWYVGAARTAQNETVSPGAMYTLNANAVLTTATISLAGATAPQLSYWVAGSSEAGFDFLRVKVVSLTAGTTTTLKEYSGDAVSNADPLLLLPTYTQETFSLAGFVGHDIQVVFHFTSDANLELGQGWNIDDVLVNE